MPRIRRVSNAELRAIASRADEMHKTWRDGSWKPQDAWAAIVAAVLRAGRVEVAYEDPAPWPPQEK